MPLPSPILDDRTFAELAAELKARIPVYNPAWTDHNDSDPGITLLELFAFQAENLLYRFNQIPEATYLEFLRLTGIPLRPATAARVLLTLTTEKPAGVALAPRTLAHAGKLEFETLGESHIWPVTAVAACKSRTELTPEESASSIADDLARTADALPAALAERERVYYETRLLDPARPGELLDLGNAVDGMLWIALLAGRGFDPGEWQKPGAPAQLTLGFEPDLPAGGIAGSAPCPGAGGSGRSPQLVFQISTRRPLREGLPQYAGLRLTADTTLGLTRAGTVRLELPGAAEEIGLPETDPDLAGAADFPPQLDQEREAKLICWIRLFLRDGSRLGRFRLIEVNAVEAEQARVAEAQFLGTGSGQPSQVYRLARRPVLPDDERGQMILEVEEGQRWLRYSAVEDLFASDRESRHFLLDPEAGTVRFGDGLRGRMPQWGERIRVRGYRYGGGAAGNVAALAIDKIALPGVKVKNPLAAAGGSDAEGIEEALRRIPAEFRRRDRAVTAGDFRELALQTPGVLVGRAECLPRFHPASGSREAAGVVSVVVWPRTDPHHPNAPMPDAALLKAVCAWLDTRRLITTELYVLPPSYRKVTIAVALKVREGYGVEAVRRWVELVLRQYLAPLPPYGPGGGGWPLGRRVYGPELEAAALQVEGVEYLEGLAVAAWDDTQGQWRPGPVELLPHELPEVAGVVVVVDGLPLPPPGAGIDPVPAAVAVPLPLLREHC